MWERGSSDGSGGLAFRQVPGAWAGAPILVVPVVQLHHQY